MGKTAKEPNRQQRTEKLDMSWLRIYAQYGIKGRSRGGGAQDICLFPTLIGIDHITTQSESKHASRCITTASIIYIHLLKNVKLKGCQISSVCAIKSKKYNHTCHSDFYTKSKASQ